MKSPETILEAQVARLLELTEDWARKRCAEILGKADEQAGAVIKAAHRDARGRLRTHVEEDRRKARRKLTAFEAALKTAQRQEQQRHDTQLLGTTWQLLYRELGDRWKEPEHRKNWIEKIVVQAQQNLPETKWHLDCSPDLAEQERALLNSRITAITGADPEWHEDHGIEAGLRICTDGACVDGTLNGLVANRERLEAEMLAIYRELCSGERAECNE